MKFSSIILSSYFLNFKNIEIPTVKNSTALIYEWRTTIFPFDILITYFFWCLLVNLLARMVNNWSIFTLCVLLMHLYIFTMLDQLSLQLKNNPLCCFLYATHSTLCSFIHLLWTSSRYLWFCCCCCLVLFFK